MYNISVNINLNSLRHTNTINLLLVYGADNPVTYKLLQICSLSETLHSFLILVVTCRHKILDKSLIKLYITVAKHTAWE